jgi:hypothetical protein
MLPSGLPDQVSDEEDLARFVRSSGGLNSQGVKPAAFMPSPRDGKTSVFRHGAEPPDSLRTIGEREVAGDRTLHAVAIVQAASVRESGLEVEAAEPPELHADITRWPMVEGDAELSKARQKELAAILAQRSRTCRFV